MKKKIKIILAAFFLMTLCSCRHIIVKTTVWVLECEHGVLTVASENGTYDFLVTAQPDEGYCLEDLYVRGGYANGSLETIISTVGIEDNVFGINLYGRSFKNIAISGRFTKVEREK